jgi:hypothetical protein
MGLLTDMIVITQAGLTVSTRCIGALLRDELVVRLLLAHFRVSAPLGRHGPGDHPPEHDYPEEGDSRPPTDRRHAVAASDAEAARSGTLLSPAFQMKEDLLRYRWGPSSGGAGG